MVLWPPLENVSISNHHQIFVNNIESDIFAAGNMADHAHENTDLPAESSQDTTSATTIPTDENSSVPADGPVNEAVETAEDTTLIPSAAVDENITGTLSAAKAPASTGRTVKRKRGRPPLHTRQAAERRHQKLLDVRTVECYQ